ncbi:MBL fold metallo-hydrolase [Candidatus Woesearchaeota archaeon]|nr:MBL fold metallo-hydrolase [Candidatus Woesearchaeota archaeon]
MIELCAVGGYSHVGRNMTAIRYEDEVVILDMGLDLESYIEMTEHEDPFTLSRKDLMVSGAIPNDQPISEWRDKAIAIIPTHAHLDHLAAIPFMAKKYKNAQILCTPFCAAVLERIATDDKRQISNKIRVLSDNSTYQLSKNLRIEFINVTHSIPDTVIIVLHTPKGSVVYANDFKFDDYPTIGKPSNTKRLSELRDVKLLIMDSLYADRPGKTQSELVAKKQLGKIILEETKNDNVMIATTFSSHIARLKTLIEYIKKTNRKPLLLGRSLSRYTSAAQDAGITRFEEECEIIKYSSKIRKKLRKMSREDLYDYFIICSGHQAEPKATLTRIIHEDLINLRKEDVIIFSSSIIPSGNNENNREELEQQIRVKGARIYKDIHASGHASQDDHKKLISLVRPKHVIPSHADKEKTFIMMRNLQKWGCKNIHVLREGDFLRIN